MNKGQLPVLGSIALAGLIIWKMEPAQVSQMAARILDRLESGCFLGYFSTVTVVVAWSWHAKVMRRDASEEYKRIGNEKTAAQEKAANQSFPSSDIR